MPLDSLTIPNGVVISGNIKAPCSKSYALRAILLAILQKKECTVQGVDLCGDIISAILLAKILGCKIDINHSEKNVIIDSTNVFYTSKELHIGESGLLARQAMLLSTFFKNEVTITGEKSILRRSFKRDIERLKLMGINCVSNDNLLPITIYPNYPETLLSFNCNDSSQFLSALLLIAPFFENETIIDVSELTSKQYIDITIDVLKGFGIEVQRTDYNHFELSAGACPNVSEYLIQGDYSSISCFAVGGALFGEGLEINNLISDSTQPDRAIIQLLEQIGAKIEIKIDSVIINKGELSTFDFDATYCPDLFPALVALAANIKGKSTIKGVGRLINKESNRAEALVMEFNKLGVMVCLCDDVMEIYGGEIAGGIEVNSHNDHRIAMSLAIASLNAKQNVTITGFNCVSKSYAAFWQDFNDILRYTDN